MTLYVSEHFGAGDLYRQGMVRPAIARYSLSSASTGPFPQAGTTHIMVSADIGMLFSINSTSTGIVLTSTNAIRIPPGLPPIVVAVCQGFRIQAAST